MRKRAGAAGGGMSFIKRIFIILLLIAALAGPVFRVAAFAEVKKVKTTETNPGVEDLRRDAPEDIVFGGGGVEDLSVDEKYLKKPPLETAPPTATPTVPLKRDTTPESFFERKTGEPEDLIPDLSGSLTRINAPEMLPVEEATSPVGIDIEPSAATETAVAATGTIEPVTAATGTQAATETMAAVPATATITPPATATDATEPAAQPETQSAIGPIQISGTAELTNRSYSWSGSEYGFRAQNGLLFKDEKFTQRVDLTFDGELGNGARVDGEFRELPYLDRVFRVSARGERYAADVGDTTAQFESGAMTKFVRNIRGVDFGYKVGGTSVGLLFSNQKSKAQSETIQGRSIRGPYVLRNTGVVTNTEVVRINGQVVPRSEYTFDYFLGELMFNRAIDPSEIIEVHYETALWLALRTGKLFGLSVESRFMKDRMSVGASYLTEETENMAAARVFNNTVSDAKNNLLDAVTGSYVFNVGQSKLEKNHELVSAIDAATTYLTRSTDYSIDYVNGVVTFATSSAAFNALSASATIVVSFNYYDQTFLQWVQDETLSGEGEIEYILSQERIYGGTEIANLYENNAYVRTLVNGTDYEVNEGRNTIVFLDPTVTPSDNYGREVRISYEITPDADTAAVEGRGDRTVKSLFGNATFGKLELGAEYAETQSDLRLKTVQVKEELVATVATPSVRRYTLQHEALYNTIEVYFNDTIGPSSRRRSGTDYVLERDPITGATALNFKADIPEGTTIIANYQYQDQATWLTDRRGRALRTTASFRSGKTGFTADYMRKGPFFAPLTSYNDLEAERLYANLDTSFSDISLSINYAHQSHNTELTTDRDRINFDKLRSRIGYKIDGRRDIAYTFETYTRADNLATTLTDNAMNSHRVDLTMRMNQTLDSTLYYETRNFEDNVPEAARRTSDRDVSNRGVLVNYAPKAALRMSLDLGNSRLDSQPPPGFANIGPFAIDTFSTRWNVAFTPRKSFRVNINLDRQNINDSRESAPDSRLEDIRAEVLGTGDSVRMIKDYALSFYRTDRPDPIYGDSRTDITAARVTFVAGADIGVTPSFTATKSKIGSGSDSSDNTAAIRVTYRADADKGLSAAASYASGSRSGHSVATSISGVSTVTTYQSDQTQLGLTFDYIPRPGLRWTGIYSDTQTVTNASPQTRNGYTAKLAWLLNEKTDLRIEYTLDNNSSSGDRTTFELGALSRIDRYLDLDIEYKFQDQSNSGGNDYSGSLLNMKLIINF